MTSQRLFTGDNLTHSLAMIGNTLLDRAANLPESAWNDPDDPSGPTRAHSAVAADVAASVTLSVPSIDWESITTSRVETSVPIRDSRRGRTITTEVRGVRVIASIPFSGTPWLFNRRPSKHTFGGINSSAVAQPLTATTGTIELRLEGRRLTPADLEAEISRLKAEVRRHLEWTAGDLGLWHEALLNALEDAVSERATWLDEIASFHPETPGNH